MENIEIVILPFFVKILLSKDHQKNLNATAGV